MGLWGNTVASVAPTDTSIAVAGTPTDPTIGVGISAARLGPTAVKSANYTAAAGELVACDTTSAGFTVTLPAAPVDKTQIAVKVVLGGNQVIIACGGSDVVNRAGGATSFTLSLLGQAATLQYHSGIWYVVSSDVSLSQLDARLRVTEPLAVGDETLSRGDVTSGALVSTSGILRLTYFTARRTEVTTQVRVLSGSTAAAATPSLVRVGLYSVDSSDNGTLIASIANDITLLAAASTASTRSWTTPTQTVAGQRYAIGLLVVTVVTPPTLAGAASLAAAAQSEANAAPRLASILSAQTDLPGSFTNVGVANSLNRYYSVVLP